MRLSLLLLVAVLHVDLLGDLCGDLSFAADDVSPKCRVEAAAFESRDPEAPAGEPLQLLEAQDFLEAAHAAPCLHRAPRLSRPLPDSGYAAASENLRRTFLCDLRTVGRTLRAHYSLYCVYRI